VNEAQIERALTVLQEAVAKPQGVGA
jgi:hypothetical protein